VPYASPPTLPPPGDGYANEQDDTESEEAELRRRYKEYADVNGLFFDPVKNLWVPK
jgi:hypothetical protein